MATIKIRNLKSIKELDFEMPLKGVYLLSGTNGAGKSSLLACIHRIGSSNAFPKNFKTSQFGKTLDQFESSTITYEANGIEVEYKYAGQRWVPMPRKNSTVLKLFGYKSVLHIAADSTRIEPRPEDFKVTKIKPAPEYLISAANLILGTVKFSALKVINLKKGVGNEAFLIEYLGADQKPRYFSEKNFSLGEICVLKLIRLLEDCERESLLLVDELELALYPKAQIELLQYLENIAKQKDLTIIFSTHSVSLIKRFNRKKILFLQNDKGVIECVSNCYPTFALGDLAYDEEYVPDLVFVVEDDNAKAMLDAMVKLYLSNEDAGKSQPTISTIPIGGYHQVLVFIARFGQLFPSTTKCHAFLDLDVKTETLPQLRKANNLNLLRIFDNVKHITSYLPETPEVALIECLSTNTSKHQSGLKTFFSDNRIQLKDAIFENFNSLQGAPKRNHAKTLCNELAQQVAKLKGTESERVLRDFFEYYVQFKYGNSLGDLKKNLGPIIKQT